MAATNKVELLDITEKEFSKLEELLDTVPPDQAMLPDAEATTIKDVIAHRAHWIDLFLGWYADGQAGKTVWFPAKGYKWNDLKCYNAALRQTQKDMGWQDAVNLLRAEHARLTGFVQGCSDAALYGGPMKGAKNNWTPGRWAEAAGPSHYRSASKYIRSRLREMRGVVAEQQQPKSGA